MSREEGQREKLLDAFTSYLNKRVDRPVGDYTQAISALHEMEKTEEVALGIPKDVAPTSTQSNVVVTHEPVGAVAIPTKDDGAFGIVNVVKESIESPPEPAYTPEAEPPLPDTNMSRARSPMRPPYKSNFDESETITSAQKTSKSIADTLEEALGESKSHTPQVRAEEDEELEAIVRSQGRRNRKKRTSTECSSCGRSPGKQGLSNCSACSVEICKSCGEYSKIHRQSQVFYDYKFEYPLCKECYLKAFKIQEEIGRASTYYGTGNMTYAQRHASRALELASSLPVGHVYLKKAKNLMTSVDRAKSGMSFRTNKSLMSGNARRERPDRSSSQDIEGDKWAKRFVERALEKKGE